MEGKHNWNAQKKELWKSPIKNLQKKLQELQTEKIRMEMRSRGYTGDMTIPISINRLGNTKESSVNLKGLRHKIAFIKTVLTVKLKPNYNQ